MVFLGLAVALAIAFLVCWAMLAVGKHTGFVDHPDRERLKLHSGSPVPLGGVAVMAGLHLGLAAAGAFDYALFVATSIVWVVGLVDDRKGLAPLWRVAASVLGGGALVVIGGFTSGLVAGIAGVALVVVALNAVNLLDGLDALAASVTAIGAVGLSAFAATQGLSGAWIGALLAAALVGFLVWNFPPARLFLGDNGAYVVGVTLAWLALRASSDWITGVVGVALIGVPLLDLAAIILRRTVARAPLLTGDRDHSYDRLRQSGFSVGAVAATYSLAQAVWVAVLISVSVLFGDVLAVVVALVLGGSTVLVFGLNRRQRMSAPG